MSQRSGFVVVASTGNRDGILSGRVEVGRDGGVEVEEDVSVCLGVEGRLFGS
jgi:hypothetical protein